MSSMLTLSLREFLEAAFRKALSDSEDRLGLVESGSSFLPSWRVDANDWWACTEKNVDDKRVVVHVWIDISVISVWWNAEEVSWAQIGFFLAFDPGFELKPA